MYSFSTSYISEKLVPPVLRQVKILAFLRVLLVSVQTKWDDFKKYISGSSEIKWSNVTAYSVGDRVKYGYSIYEALQSSTGEIPFENTDYWLLVNKDFVGCDARVKFNSDKIVFDYVLNLYLNITPTTIPTIYTTRNQVDANGFYMGVDGDGLFGELGTDENQNDFMGTAYSLGQYAMTIYVPLALYTSLASNAADREARVRNIADRYVMAGVLYEIQTY